MTIQLTINPEAIVTWVIIGLTAGALAGLIVRGRRYSALTSLITGLIGAVVGGIVYQVLNLQSITSPALLDGPKLRWIDFIVAFLGALLVFLIIGVLYGFRRRA